MENKPVAWMTKKSLESLLIPFLSQLTLMTALKASKVDDFNIPLYTHPVKEQDCYGDGNVYRGVRSKDSEIQTIHFNPVKELTDEEYEKLMQQWDYWRKQIADGDTSSAPRDWFESVIDLLKQY